MRLRSARPIEVSVGRREIIQVLVMADVVIMLDEGFDPPFEIAGQVVV